MTSPTKLYVALDMDESGALALADGLSGLGVGLKVGLTLFIQSGPRLVETLVQKGFPVFLDLKLHDIPHQVGLAVSSACQLGADLLTIHTGGGRAMMEAAANAASESATRVIGVTVLTSMSDGDGSDVGFGGAVSELVLSRAQLAQRAGLDGVVSAPTDAANIRSRCSSPFLIVTPGIRPAGAERQDQQRIATPGDAVRAGSDVLVVGRPITQASSPVAAAAALLEEISHGS